MRRSYAAELGCAGMTLRRNTRLNTEYSDVLTNAVSTVRLMASPLHAALSSRLKGLSLRLEVFYCLINAEFERWIRIATESRKRMH